ncbi:MAG: rhomboid family intramembrane serine protease [Chloroflexi bacterium]|nr:rhomboid family intramembrane serine protease [Chloroflexota bacterium]
MFHVNRWRPGPWRPAPVTGVLLAANTAVFLLQAAQGPVGQEWIVRYGLIPAVLMQGERFSIPGSPTPYALTLLSSSFLHGNLGHLVVNLAFIAVLGSLVERAVGAWRVAVLWTAAVVLGGVFHVLMNSGSIVPTVGASAGVAGLIGVVTVGGWGGLIAGGLWLSVQVAGAMARAPQLLDPEVAWQAHLAGYTVGVVGGLLVRWEIRRRRRAARRVGAEPRAPGTAASRAGGQGGRRG